MVTERPPSHEAATAVLVAALFAAGAALPPVIGVVAAGVGVEVLGDLTERTWDRIRGRFLTDQVLLDSDLQAAMWRAYVHAISELERAWWQTPPGTHAKRGPQEQREPIEELFRMLREDAERILSNERLHELASDPVALQTLGNDASAQLVFGQYLDAYLHGHDQQLTAFIRRNLEPQLAKSFATELQADTPAGNRAWRAFQLLVLGNLLASIAVLGLKQEAVIKHLEDLKIALEQLTPDRRDRNGVAGLDHIVAESEERIVASLAEQFERQQDEVRGWFQFTADLVAREADQTRVESRADHDLTRAVVRETGELIWQLLSPTDSARTPLVGETKSPRKLFNVPYRPNNLLVGRDEDLANLATVLADAGPPPPVVTLYGLGGVGKTQIAVTYAFRQSSEIPVIWWINASDPIVLAENFRAFARALELPEADAEEIADTIAALKNQLARSDEKWLLIFDNAESEYVIRPYLPDLGKGQVIITSRSPSFDNLGAQLRVDTLTPEQGAEYLRRRTGSREDVAALELATELGGLPLALVQAGAYIRERHVSIRKYIGVYEEYRLRLLEEGRPESDYPHTVATTWEVSFREIERRSTAAAQLLRLCSFLAPDALPLEIIEEQRAILPGELSEALGNELTARRTVRELSRFSLIDVIDDQTMAMHRLVQAVARDRLSERDRAYEALTSIKLIFLAFPRDGGDSRTWPRCERLLAHGLTAALLAERNGVAPDGIAHVFDSIAKYLRARANYEEAEVLLKRAMAILVTAFPESPHFALGLVADDLGRVYQDLGRYAESKTQFERGLELTEASFGENHPNTAACHSNLGDLLSEIGDIDSAVRHLEEAVAILENQPDPDYPAIATTLGKLGAALRLLGEYQRAWEYSKRGLEIDLAEFGPQHLSVAYAYNHLGQILGDVSRFGKGHESTEQLELWSKQAEDFFHRALIIFINTHREDDQIRPHPEIAMVLKNLGNLVRHQGECPAAREYLEQALIVARHVYPQNHPFIMETIENLDALDC